MSIVWQPVDRDQIKPAHMQVRDKLLAMVLDGILEAGAKLPPEPEIADLMGVSRMTANKAILTLVRDGWLVRGRGKGTFVVDRSVATPGEGEVDKVKRIAIAVEMDADSVLNDYYFGPLYWGVHRRLHSLGFAVEIVPFQDLSSSKVTACEGMISIAPSSSFVEPLMQYQRKGGALVILGAEWRDYNFRQIDSDNTLGAALAVNHLLDLGHRDIMFIGGEPQNSNTLDRAHGFRLSLKTRGIPVREEWIWVGQGANHLTEEMKERLEILLRSHQHPTAMFVAGAKLALSTLSVIYHCDLRVPEDISIVAYDDPQFLGMAYPPLTTVRQPLEEMASAACNALLDQLSRRDPLIETQVIDPDLVLRASSAPRHAPLGLRD